jgi:putative aminopeptidase FrvX
MKLLKQLCEIHAPSGNEAPMKEFLLRYIKKESKKWNFNQKYTTAKHFRTALC